MSLSPATEISGLDELLDVLSHTHQRRILTRLSDHNPREEDELAQQTPAFSSNLLGVELFHYHLPKLDGAGFIDWDREQGVVRRGERFHEIAPLIDLLVDHLDELTAGGP